MGKANDTGGGPQIGGVLRTIAALLVVLLALLLIALVLGFISRESLGPLVTDLLLIAGIVALASLALALLMPRKN